MRRLIRKAFKPKAISNVFSGMDEVEIDIDRKAVTPIFITGPGRSGTHFMADIMGHSNNAQAYHLDEIGNPVGDSFLFYSSFNRMPVDNEGFLHSRDFLIHEAAKEDKVFVESNPYLAFSVEDLKKAYPLARFVIMVREPEKVVKSHLNKGWYKEECRKADSSLLVGFQYNLKLDNHFFGRIMPSDKEDYKIFQKLSRAGKIAWMCAMVYERIDEAIIQIGEQDVVIENIESFDYSRYKALCKTMQFGSVLSQTEFDSLRVKPAGKGTYKKVVELSDVEKDEVGNIVQDNIFYQKHLGNGE